MKKLLSILLGILLLSGCAATYDGPTRTVPQLTEYTVSHYYAFWGNEEVHYRDRTVYAYDIYGNRVREMEYRDNELQIVTNLKYDDRATAFPGPSGTIPAGSRNSTDGSKWPLTTGTASSAMSITIFGAAWRAEAGTPTTTKPGPAPGITI